jgi:hypothetical protein
MAVVLHKNDIRGFGRKDWRCTLCDGYLYFPFMVWDPEI